MGNKERHDFPELVKSDVRRQQDWYCADCGMLCQGHEKPKLEIHHVVPDCQGGGNTRENAVGLCPVCHRKHDKAAICDGKDFYEVLLEEGRWSDVISLERMAGRHKASPASRRPLRPRLATTCSLSREVGDGGERW